MAESIKADESDVHIGSDSGTSDVVAQGGEPSAAGGEMAEVESVDLGEIEPPEVPEPPEPQPLPMGIDQIGQEVSEPGRQAEDVDASRSGDELDRGDLSFQALIGDLQREYAAQQQPTEPIDSGDFSAAVATAKNALNSARGQSLENETKRAGEYGEFVQTQREAEERRQQDFQAREEERVNLLQGWNDQLNTMKQDAQARNDTWNTFLGEQQGSAQTRANEWNEFLRTAHDNAFRRAGEWGTFMHGQQEAAFMRQQRWEQFMAAQEAQAAARQARYEEWLRTRQQPSGRR